MTFTTSFDCFEPGSLDGPGLSMDLKEKGSHLRFPSSFKKMDKDLLFGVMTVVGVTLLHHTFGFLYASSDLVPYLQDYFNTSSGAITFYTSSLFACEAISTPLGAMLSQIIGFRWSTFISILLTSGGLLLSQLTLNYGLGPLIFTSSIMFGFGIGASYSVLYAVATAWFPNHRSIIVGIIASGLGLGALVLVPIQTAVINPNNLQNFTHPEVKNNIPKAFSVLGGFILCLQIIGFALLREKHSDVEMSIELSTIADSQTVETVTENEKESIVRNYTTLEALRTIDFYLAFLINFFNSALTGLTSSTVKTYGRDCGFDNNFLVIVLTLSSVFNCLGRLTWGIIGNRYSFKGPLIILQIEWASLWFTYGFVTQVGGTAAKALFAIWTFLLYTCLAANFVLIPNLATRIFGPRSMPTIFGLLFAAMAPSTLILSGVIAHFDIRGQWVPIYCSGAGFAVIGLILTLFLRDPNGACTAWTNSCARVCDCCRCDPKEEDVWNKPETSDKKEFN